MREEMRRRDLGRGTRPRADEMDEMGSRRLEGVLWTIGCLQRVMRGESCIFDLHCAPFDTSNDLVGVPCGLRRRNITLGIHYD